MLTLPWWKEVYLLNHLVLDGALLPVAARATNIVSTELTGIRKPLALNAWGDRWNSNPRQPEPQSGVLPTELRPHGTKV